jgi:hypothetical protein
MHRDLVVTEVDVFDPQPDAFHETQSIALEQLCHEPVVALELRQDATDLLWSEHYWHLWGAFDPLDAIHKIEPSIQDLLVKEEQSAQGLILG